MSSPRRSTFKIVLDVLNAIREQSKPTRIMYMTNMSWKPLQRALNALVKLGFVHKKESSSNSRSKAAYFITPEGEHRLEQMNKMMGLIEKINLLMREG